MSDPSTRLLQMLEPAVRPGQAGRAGGPAAPPQGDAPFEGKSFDELLRTAADPEPSEPQTAGDAARPDPAGPLDPLASLDRIENASLTRLLSDHGNRNAQADADPNP